MTAPVLAPQVSAESLSIEGYSPDHFTNFPVLRACLWILGMFLLGTNTPGGSFSISAVIERRYVMTKFEKVPTSTLTKRAIAPPASLLLLPQLFSLLERCFSSTEASI